MKIAIIGGGWVGCHLANKFKNIHNITIFERNEYLFTETSYNNQNRLHIGFHYPRNSQTRELCYNTFDKFINDYNFLITDVNPNLYCISKENSLLDFNTYIKIFDDYIFNIENLSKYNLENIEGCINTNEKHINFIKAFNFFNENLKENKVIKNITKDDLLLLKKEYDIVINCTNNLLYDDNVDNHFYELTLTLIYKKIKQTTFNSLTIMDGKFLSIYPYIDNLYTLTDVENTPLKSFDNIYSLIDFKNKIDNKLIEYKKILFEDKVKKYFINFNEYFQYNDYILSTKSKIISNTDNRYPIITESDNIVNCFTGKIQGIYIIENYIKNKIKNYENTDIF
jgi:molybdopterin/thiamine biosynthesis adenylyltransferase